MITWPGSDGADLSFFFETSTLRSDFFLTLRSEFECAFTPGIAEQLPCSFVFF